MTQEKLEAVCARLIQVYPEPLEVEAIVDEDRIVFIGTAFTREGPYPIAGFVTLDELIRLRIDQVAALVFMRSLVDDLTEDGS